MDTPFEIRIYDDYRLIHVAGFQTMEEVVKRYDLDCKILLKTGHRGHIEMLHDEDEYFTAIIAERGFDYAY